MKLRNYWLIYSGFFLALGIFYLYKGDFWSTWSQLGFILTGAVGYSYSLLLEATRGLIIPSHVSSAPIYMADQQGNSFVWDPIEEKWRPHEGLPEELEI